MKVCVLIVALLVACTFAQLDPNYLVNEHAKVRANPPSGQPSRPLQALQWHNDLATYAQQFSAKCVSGNSDYKSAGYYGESKYYSNDASVVTQALQYWEYVGQYLYNIQTDSCANGYTCDEYKQMVGANTAYFGCGLSRCGSGYWLVCNYWQPTLPGVPPYQLAGGSTSGRPISTSSSVTTGRSATTSTITTGRGTTGRGTSTSSNTGGNYNRKPSIDYRNTPMVLSIRNQEQCGSCWAFSATAVVEGAMGKKYGVPTPLLSEQDTLDCSDGGSCDGGWPDDALAGIIKQGGLDTDASYPYQSQQGQCRHTSSNVKGKISQHGNPRSTSFEDMYSALATYGPIGITVEVDDTFSYYTKGVLRAQKTEINHAVVLVGYDDNQQAWIVRNSWGSDWGVNGYVYIGVDQPYGADSQLASWAVAA